jgi:hypothetical protein
MKIKCKSRVEQLSMIAYLLALGYTWHKSNPTDPKTLSDIIEHYPPETLDEKNLIDVNPSDRSMSFYSRYSGGTSTHSWPEESSVIAKLAFAPQPVNILLNKEYIAEVRADGIHVGCQTFPLSIAKALYDAVQKLEK